MHFDTARAGYDRGALQTDTVVHGPAAHAYRMCASP